MKEELLRQGNNRTFRSGRKIIRIIGITLIALVATSL